MLDRRKIKKIAIIAIVIIIFFAVFVPKIGAQDILTDYNTLMVEYEELLDDYEEVIDELDYLNTLYKREVNMHELSKEQILMDQREIKMLRDDNQNLIRLVDPQYFTLYIIGGYQGTNPLGELAITASVPKIPFSVYAAAEYIFMNGVNMKLGVGVKF